MWFDVYTSVFWYVMMWDVHMWHVHIWRGICSCVSVNVGEYVYASVCGMCICAGIGENVVCACVCVSVSCMWYVSVFGV